MKRGEIYFASLDPSIGDETKKYRPVLIVSNNANNKIASTLTIVPLTSNTNKIFPFEVFLSISASGLNKPSKAQCHQIRTISKHRINNPIPAGKVKESVMLQIQTALKIHLDFK